ncbi:hypothetical protein, partial [Pseudomonas aeruginosa]|uniref:hypothetical protein n=1 Tax=Pseudomonas aeruginosa TaxID=287 RepID=UPI0019696E99
LLAASPSIDAGFSIGPRSGREAHDARTAQQIAAAAVLRHAAEGLSTKDEYWSDGLDMGAPVTWHGAMLNRAVRFSQERESNDKSNDVKVLLESS